MIRALRDFSLLWRAALLTRHRYANAWLCVLGVFSALFVAALVLFKTNDSVFAAINGLRAAFAVLVFGWLVYFVPGAIKLNTPANARLVPRMRRRLVQLTALVWAAAVGLSTLLALDTPIGAHLVFLGVGTWLIALGLARSGHPAGQALQFAFPLLIILKPIPPAWLASLAGMPGFAVAGVLMLALGAFTLDMMFPHGGDRHYQLHAAQKKAADKMTAEGQFRHVRVPRLGLWIYQAALARDCSGRDARALLMHMLGPGEHWTRSLLPMAFLVGIAAGAMAVVRRLASADTLEAIAGGAWIAVSVLLVVQLFDYERRVMRLSFTKGEQSLVRLAPSMPGAAGAFNRYLATRLLRAGLGEWTIVAVAVMCIVALTGASAATLWKQACLCCLTLPLLASTLRDHARRSGSGGWRFVLWQAVSLGACLLAGAFAQRLLGTPVLPVAALASLLLTAAAVAWRWSRLAGAAHAFPVGRLA